MIVYAILNIALAVEYIIVLYVTSCFQLHK